MCLTLPSHDRQTTRRRIPIPSLKERLCESKKPALPTDGLLRLKDRQTRVCVSLCFEVWKIATGSCITLAKAEERSGGLRMVIDGYVVDGAFRAHRRAPPERAEDWRQTALAVSLLDRLGHAMLYSWPVTSAKIKAPSRERRS